MKIIFYLFLITVISFCQFSCDNSLNDSCVKGSKNIAYDYRILPDYNSIFTECGGNYYISQEHNDTLIIETDDNIIPLIHTSLDNGKLMIESESMCPTRLNFRAYMKELNRFSLGGSGNILGSDTIHANYLNIDIDGSGTIDLFGTCKLYSIKLNGSGNITLMNFLTDSARVELGGSGTINVNASKYVYAHINGSGNIYYKGNPTVKDLKISGSGNIISVP